MKKRQRLRKWRRAARKLGRLFARQNQIEREEYYAMVVAALARTRGGAQ